MNAKFYAVNAGRLHGMDEYTTYSDGYWATYIAQDGCKYGVEADLIASTADVAAEKFIAKCEGMVQRCLRDVKAAQERASEWRASADAFKASLTK